MASLQQVKIYLAYWFQLGKKVWLRNGQEKILPQPVIEGDRYSQQFESCWQRILERKGQDCYLEGTNQTIEQLLTPQWEIMPCARCEMPVAMIDLGTASPDCPCSDLYNWPNTELPSPREPIQNKVYLTKIQARLQQNQQDFLEENSHNNNSINVICDTFGIAQERSR
jgi:hypothetical protein